VLLRRFKVLKNLGLRGFKELIEISDNCPDDQKRFQELVARENSTLVLSTVASSLSLALLVGLVTYQLNESIRNALFWSGLLFVLCGYSYRELTIHVVDIEDSKELGLLKKARDGWSKMKRKRKFFIEKKDGTKIGVVNTFPVAELLEIGFTLIPSERGKDYGTEAVTILIDYLFLSRDLVRIQAYTDPRNMVSQRVLEKVGFKREGVVRKSMFIHGEWRDLLLYSILREEWKEPKILTKTRQ
jgi:RimJ/RimL family protein N-acetyltransferase